jgi:hypothetical protein
VRGHRSRSRSRAPALTQHCRGCAALLFALHPVHVEPVGGLVGAAELLCACVSLGGLRCYVHACGAAPQPHGARAPLLRAAPRLALALALLAAMAAALAKETGITILIAFVSYEWLIAALPATHALAAGGGGAGDDARGAEDAGAGAAAAPPPTPTLTSAKQRKAAARRGPTPAPEEPRGSAGARRRAGAAAPASLPPPRLLRLAATVATGVAYLVLRRAILGGKTLVQQWRIVDNHLPFLPTRAARGLSVAHAHWRFIYLLLWPVQLCADWNYACIPPVSSARDPRNSGAAALYLAAAACLLAARPWRLRAAAVAAAPRSLVAARLRLFHAVALVAAPLLPAANLLFYVGAYLAERLLYLPSVGFCALLASPLAAALAAPTGAEGSQARRARRAATALLTAALLVGYGARTVARVPVWDSEAALFGAALSVCPGGAKVNVNAGVQARLRGDAAAAERHFRAALAILPQDYCEVRPARAQRAAA